MAHVNLAAAAAPSRTPRAGALRCASPVEWFSMAFADWDAVRSDGSAGGGGDGGSAPSASSAASSSAAPVCVCVHGLTRNGRDFDWLAERLSGRGVRVVCPDVVGRGQSSRLVHFEHYGYPLYASSVGALLSHVSAPPSSVPATAAAAAAAADAAAGEQPQLGFTGAAAVGAAASQVDYVGTSMGGLIGMMLAAVPGSPIRRLVLNDIGAVVEREALVRIASYVGHERRFADEAAAVDYFMDVHKPFGLSRSQWEHLVPFCVRKKTDDDDDDDEGSDGTSKKGGALTLGYDLNIGHAFRDTDKLETVEMWAVWEAIKCPIMLVRGAESDLIRADVVEEMQRRNPNLRVVHTVPGVGHAPGLADEAQMSAIQSFFDADGESW